MILLRQLLRHIRMMVDQLRAAQYKDLLDLGTKLKSLPGGSMRCRQDQASERILRRCVQEVEGANDDCGRDGHGVADRHSGRAVVWLAGILP
jgi:hypothetical protein